MNLGWIFFCVTFLVVLYLFWRVITAPKVGPVSDLEHLQARAELARLNAEIAANKLVLEPTPLGSSQISFSDLQMVPICRIFTEQRMRSRDWIKEVGCYTDIQFAMHLAKSRPQIEVAMVPAYLLPDGRYVSCDLSKEFNIRQPQWDGHKPVVEGESYELFPSQKVGLRPAADTEDSL